MSPLPADLIIRPAAEGARLVALDYLEQSRAALARLDDPSDREALHDFRVALRRLRSTLRAYRPQLHGSVPRKVGNRVRDLTRSTNRGRDAEVQLAWLRPLPDELTAAERVGWRWLVEWIEHAHDEAVEETRDRLRRSFDKLDRQLRKKLGVYPQAVTAEPTTPEPTFGVVARDVLLAHAHRLDDLLGAIHSSDDQSTIHRARIAAKRLRYIMEPLKEALLGGPRLVSELKSLQDLLGELCDTHVLEDTLVRAVENAGAERARRRFESALANGLADKGLRVPRRSEMRGLLAVARLLRQRRIVAFAKLETTWLGGGDVFVGKIDGAARPLPVRRAVPVPPPAPRSRTVRRPRAGRSH